MMIFRPAGLIPAERQKHELMEGDEEELEVEATTEEETTDALA